MAHGKVEKTNAARLLDRAKITYELVPYRVDEEHLAATHVAEELGEDRKRIQDPRAAGRPHGAFRMRGARRPRGRPQGRRTRIGQQEGRPDSDEGAAARDGLHPWRLLADRHEKTVSDLYPLLGRVASGHLHQRRRPRPPTENRPGGAHSFRRGDRGGNQPGRVVPE